MIEDLLLEIEDSMERCDATGLAINVEELLQATDEETACKELSMKLFNRYTTFKAESTAKLMEVIIRTSPDLAMLKFPENFLFRVAILKGSTELYECYIEEAILPFLEDKTEDEIMDCYSDLYNIADQLNSVFFPKYVKCIKRMDFNGAFANDESNQNICLINREDYEMMDEVVEKYNAIVGKRDIMKDLEERMGVRKVALDYI